MDFPLPEGSNRLGRIFVLRQLFQSAGVVTDPIEEVFELVDPRDILDVLCRWLVGRFDSAELILQRRILQLESLLLFVGLLFLILGCACELSRSGSK